MKKLFSLIAIALFVITTTSYCQEENDLWYSATRSPNDFTLLYGSPHGITFSVPMNYFEPASPGESIFLNENAEDFDIPEGENWTVHLLKFISDFNPIDQTILFFDVRFYEEVNNADYYGNPELVPFIEQHIINATYSPILQNSYVVDLPLTSPVSLAGGKSYWVSIAAGTTSSSPGAVKWYLVSPPDSPGSPQTFRARTTPVEPTWSFGPTYYGDGYPPELTLAIFGNYDTGSVIVIPLAGWMIPLLFGLFIFVTVLRLKR